MKRYFPSRNYLYLGILAFALSAFCSYLALYWPMSAVPAGLFLFTALLNIFLSSRPVIEIRQISITIGKDEYLWTDILRIERTGWISPLVLHLFLKDGRKLLVIYPGALESSRKLAEDIGCHFRASQEDTSNEASEQGSQQKRPPILSSDDAAEVERLFQRLKSVGHLEPGSPEEK